MYGQAGQLLSHRLRNIIMGYCGPMLYRQFNDKRVTQVAARFLQLECKPMKYMKLLKLLYIADRKAILQGKKPFSGDEYYSMKLGPVLSNTYDLIKHPDGMSYWHGHISIQGYYASLIKVPSSDSLSRFAERIIGETYKTHSALDEWQISQLTH